MSDEAKLVAAILRRDFDEATKLVEIMKWTSERWSRAVLEGRKAVTPPAPLPRLAEPFILPIPDQPVGMSLAGTMMSEHYKKGN